MRAAVCYASDERLVIEDRPVPHPGPGEVLVRIRRCGICGSELGAMKRPRRVFPGGLVLGHEYAGEIAAIGSDVSGLHPGQLVALYPAEGCGECPACRRGSAILCKSARRLLGGFAEYAAIPAACAIPLAKGLTPADGALVEPLTVSYHGAKSAQIEAGDRVLVLGSGSIALSAVYWARRMGAGPILVMSRSDRRAAKAREMGADAYATYGEQDEEQVAALLGGPPDVVFECVGQPGFLGKAISHAASFGRIVSLGLASAEEPVSALLAGMKDLTIHFTVGYSIRDFEHVAAEIANGHVDPKRMITSVIGLPDLPGAFAQLSGAHNEVKVQIEL